MSIKISKLISTAIIMVMMTEATFKAVKLQCVANFTMLQFINYFA